MKNVLLLGNGIDRAYNKSAISWARLLDKMTTVSELPIHDVLPFPLEVVLRTNDHVDEALAKYHHDLYSSAEDEELRSVVRILLTMGFDDILTTNYDYVLEGTAFYPAKITPSRISSLMEHTSAINRAESRYLLHTYNAVCSEGVQNRVWHIHGEARKPSSIIIGHYMYVNLVSKWREQIKKREDSYKEYDHTKPTACWLDTFIMSNVYVLGFGFAFSELDLWWLLNRKKREKEPHGKVIFYSPEDNKDAAKYALLRAYGAEVRHLEYKLIDQIKDESFEDNAENQKEEERINDFNKQAYKHFYIDALEDIRKELISEKQKLS